MATTVSDHALKQQLAGMSRKDLLELAKRSKVLEKSLRRDGPTDDDELHTWLRVNLGIDIPRVAVCAHHDAPFKFLADLYFERCASALLMANRGGSKTFLVAVLHLLNSLFKPGTESCTIGAIEMQARRAYMHLQKLLQKFGQEDVAAAIMSETRFKNGSRVEIMPGTIAAVNGPHPQKVHADEVELMDVEVFDESRNMSQGAVIEGKRTNAQDIITSTRKRGHGPMQKLLDEIKEAELDGNEPPYKLYQWCTFETAERVPNCQVADPTCDSPCPCDSVVKGRWEDGSARTLKSVCKGRLAKSDGWVPLNDVINTFTHTSIQIWEAQQECIKPSQEGLVVPNFSRERHAIRVFDCHPDNGRIYMSVDFGGTNPHAVHWYQRLDVEVIADRYDGTPVKLMPGSIVCFDEIYIAEVGNMKLAKMIIRREAKWRERHHSFKVFKRFADVASKAARLDFAKHDPPLKTVFRITREVDEHIKAIVNLVDDDLLYVDADRCVMWCEEIEAWHYPDPKAGFEYDPEIPVDDFNHAMSDLRYAVGNILSLEMSPRHKHGRSMPTGSGAVHRAKSPRSLPQAAGGRRQALRPEKWRQGLGEPIT